MKSKEVRYWNVFEHVADDWYHVNTTLGRLIGVPPDGLLMKLFGDTQWMWAPARYHLITARGTAYMPAELLAEVHFAFGRPDRALKIMQTDPDALEKICNIELGLQEYWLLDEFVTLALSIRARKVIENALLEISHG